jgi:hypothetical protein
MPGNSLIGNLAVTLGLNTAAFERGATKAEARAKALQGRLAGVGTSLKGLAAGFGIAIGVTALTGFAKNAFDVAAAMDESAQKMGVTVEAFQRLNLAATQNGISQESLAGAMAKFNKNIGLLAQGSPQAAAAFAKIGLSFDDLKGKAPEQQLAIIADALNKLPDVQQRVAVGAQIMGRGFSELLPLINGGSAGLEHYAEVSKQQGELSTEDAKQLDALSDSWDRLKVRTGVAAARMIAMFAELADKLDQSLAKWYSWRDGTIQAVESLASGAVTALGNMVEGIRNVISGKLNAIWEGAKSKIDSVKQKFFEMYDAVVGHSYVPDMVQGIGNEFARLEQIMVDPSIKASDKVAAAFQGLANVAGSIFGHKAGGIFAGIASAVTALAPLFGGPQLSGLGLSDPTSLIKTSGGVPHFAQGGSGVFGGLGGVDKNVLSLNGSPIARVSKGERFKVSPANDSLRVQVVKGDLFDVIVDRRAANVAAPMAGRAAVSGAAGGFAAVNHRQQRTFP